MGKVAGAEVRDRKCWKHLLPSPSTPLPRSSSHPTGEGSPAPSLQSYFGQSPSGIPTLQRGNLQRAWLWAVTGGMVGITDGKNRLDIFCRLAHTQDKIKHPALSLGKGQKQKMLSDLYLGQDFFVSKIQMVPWCLKAYCQLCTWDDEEYLVSPYKVLALGTRLPTPPPALPLFPLCSTLK